MQTPFYCVAFLFMTESGYIDGMLASLAGDCRRATMKLTAEKLKTSAPGISEESQWMLPGVKDTL